MIMRKTFSIMAIAAAVLLSACRGDNFGYLPPSDALSVVYRGQTMSMSPEGFYTMENSILEISLPVNRDTLYNLVFHKVKFYEQMQPVNLKIAGVKYSRDGEISSFTADGIVPTIGSEKHPEYTVRNLYGEVYQGAATFNMKCGDIDVSYSGIQVTE